jgi:ribonuclease HI
MTSTWILYFDGGSRGNPGLAGSGASLTTLQGVEIGWVSHYFSDGPKTNNVAEYTGLLLGLEYACNLLKTDVEKPSRILVRGDSLLIIRQMRGEYRCHAAGLQPMYHSCRRIVDEWQPLVHIEFEHIPRRLNGRADELANQAMDKRVSTIFRVV